MHAATSKNLAKEIEDEGKEIVMFSMTVKDLMTIVSIPTYAAAV
jgi:hypothetical protein